MDSRYLIGHIVADGCYLVRIRGSHHHYKHPTKPGLVTIPHPKKGSVGQDCQEHFETGSAELNVCGGQTHAVPHRNFNR